MKKLLFLAFVALALCGCGDSTNDIDVTDDTRHNEENLDAGWLWYGHFITEYVAPSKIEVVEKKNGEFYLKIHGEEYVTCTDTKDSPNYKKASEFAVLYGDTNCKKGVSPGQHKSLAYPIDKITVSCNDDFDAEHPAGESLDDVIRLEYKTFYEYVKNGYEYPKDIALGTPDGEGGIDYSLSIDKIKAEYATLVFLRSNDKTTASPLIKFDAVPAEPGEYTFTLEMTTNGETLKTVFTHKFE